MINIICVFWFGDINLYSPGKAVSYTAQKM